MLPIKLQVPWLHTKTASADAYCSANSRRRRTVLCTRRDQISASWRIIKDGLQNAHLRTVAAAVVETVQAPPAVVFLQALQCQIPTAVRLTESYERIRRPMCLCQRAQLILDWDTAKCRQRNSVVEREPFPMQQCLDDHAELRHRRPNGGFDHHEMTLTLPQKVQLKERDKV